MALLPAPFIFNDAGKLTGTQNFDGDFGAEILTSWRILKQSYY